MRIKAVQNDTDYLMKHLSIGKYDAVALPLWSKSALLIYEAKRSKNVAKQHFIAEGNFINDSDLMFL